MNPLYQLKAVAVQLESEGRYALARQIVRAEKQARLVTGASDEVTLDSWSSFENWFLKNRAQGLEFVAEDKWGTNSKEAQAFKDILEGYDLVERKLHDVYIMLRGDAEAQPEPAEEEVAEPEPADALDEAAADLAADEAPEEALADEALAEEPAEEAATALGDEEAATELGNEEADETVDEGEAEEETPEEPIEEEVAGKEASASPEAKMIKRIQKLLRRGNVNTNSIIFRGNGTYRVLCANSEDGDNATKFFTDKGWDLKREDHVTGRVFVDITP